MKAPSYRERSGRQADFRVRYRFLTEAEGGRHSLPFQHIRSDFLYEGDDPTTDGVWCIWPEFLGPAGHVIPEDERVPAEGLADMFILNDDLRPEHRLRIRAGTKGFFVEGARRTAACEVVEVLSLNRANELR